MFIRGERKGFKTKRLLPATLRDRTIFMHKFKVKVKTDVLHLVIFILSLIKKY